MRGGPWPRRLLLTALATLALASLWWLWHWQYAQAQAEVVQKFR